MILRTYGIFDGVLGEYCRTFNAKNDEEAKRASEYIVREKGFDDIAGKDRVINYLYSMDTETGVITDNSVHVICNLSTFIESRKRDLVEEQIRSKLMNDEFVAELKKEITDSIMKGALKEDAKESN